MPQKCLGLSTFGVLLQQHQFNYKSTAVEKCHSVFLEGYSHIGNCIAQVDPQQKLYLAVPYMSMIGENKDVQIKCLFVVFQRLIDVKLEEMEITNGKISIKSLLQPQILTQAQIISMKTKLVNIDFKFISQVLIKDSSNGTNLLSISGTSITNTSYLLTKCTLFNGTFDLCAYLM